MIQSLALQGKTIIITSHIMDTLTSICDQIHHLEKGVIINSYQKGSYQALKEILFEQYHSYSEEWLKSIR